MKDEPFYSNCGGYLSEITLNDGTTISLKQNSIVLFVGPNNAGKSQCLKDIMALNDPAEASRFGIVIKSQKLEKNGDRIQDLLKGVLTISPTNQGYYYEDAFIPQYYVNNQEYFVKNDTNSFGLLRPVFISDITTESRLLFCKSVNNVDYNKEPLKHPIHRMATDCEFLRLTSELFNKAFETHLYCYSKGKTASLHVGNISNQMSGESRLDNAYAYDQDVYSLPLLDNQGDGMKSFASVILHLSTPYKRIFLIDEPESFLHKPQARIMGQLLGQELRDYQQAFISTHSEDIIKGLMDVAKERLIIIRITRKDDRNFFHVLSNEVFSKVAEDALLRHTDILSGLFSENTVICESDSDCLIFAMLEEHIANSKNHFPQTVYLRSGGKTAIPKMIESLRNLGVQTKTVLDIDALNQKGFLGRLLTASGHSFSLLEENYKVFEGWLDSRPNPPLTVSAVEARLSQALKQIKNPTLDPNDERMLRKAIKGDGVWEELKRDGKKVIDDRNALSAFEKITEQLRLLGIFVIEEGEIEGFIKENGTHSYTWIEEVLKDHPSFDDPAYSKMKEFVQMLIS